MIRLPKVLSDLITTTLSPLIEKARSGAQGDAIAGPLFFLCLFLIFVFLHCQSEFLHVLEYFLGEDTQLFKFIVNGEYTIKNFPSIGKAKVAQLKTMGDSILYKVLPLLTEDL